MWFEEVSICIITAYFLNVTCPIVGSRFEFSDLSVRDVQLLQSTKYLSKQPSPSLLFMLFSVTTLSASSTSIGPSASIRSKSVSTIISSPAALIVRACVRMLSRGSDTAIEPGLFVVFVGLVPIGQSLQLIFGN